MEGAGTAAEKRLRELYTRMLRVRFLAEKDEPLSNDQLRTLVRLGAKVVEEMQDIMGEEAYERLDTWTKRIQHVMNMRAELAKQAKLIRIQRWREKVAGSLKEACQWLKGEVEQLTHLLALGGIAAHPQDLADEVDRRSREQFCQEPDEEKRAKFFREMSGFIDKRHCELPEIHPTRLKKFVLRKLDGAIGTDGWHARELQLLPGQAWIQLAELCEVVEQNGEWPQALVHSLTVGLRKPGPASKGVRLRMLRVMPRIMRGWASMRLADLSGWMAKWLPKELYGAVQGQGTATASAPVAVAMVKATAAEEAIIGASLDYSMCFDNIDAFLAIQVLQLFGLPAGMVRALKVLYRQIVCLTRVGQATAPTFRAFLGILQGCAWSGVLLSGLMAAWVRATRAHLDKTTLKKIKVLPSIYLDDRNIVTENPKVMHDILLFSAWYDDLINMKLNEDRCQLYSSPALPPE